MIKTVILTTLLITSILPYDSKRLLLIYADKVTNSKLLQQQQLLNADPSGLQERDLRVKVYLQHKNAGAFAEKHIKEPFTIILIGKDGGEKLRMHEVLSLRKLYGTIDAMPMRMEEMKKH